jgi:hypothetical protein
VTRITEGFNDFVTSTVAPVASGWSGCRVGFAPTGKAPPFHGAHPKLTFIGTAFRPAIRLVWLLAGLDKDKLPLEQGVASESPGAIVYVQADPLVHIFSS